MVKKEERLQVRVSSKLIERLDRVCEKEGLSRSDALIYAINKYITEVEEKLKP